LKLRSRRWVRDQSTTRRDAGFTSLAAMSRVLELSQLVEQFAAWPGCGQMTHRCVISHDSGHRRGAWAATVIPAIDQHVADAGCAQFAEGDFVVVGRHGAHCTSGQCASGQLSLTRFLSLGRFRTDLHRYSKPQPRTAPVASPRLGPCCLTALLADRDSGTERKLPPTRGQYRGNRSAHRTRRWSAFRRRLF
jgi:hypothetical protein